MQTLVLYHTAEPVRERMRRADLIAIAERVFSTGTGQEELASELASALASAQRSSGQHVNEAARACSLMVMAAVLAFDDRAVARWTAEVAKLASASPEAALRFEVARLWNMLVDHPPRDRTGEARSAFKKALAARLPDLVVETSCLEALAASIADDTTRAIEIARRASRMAQAEAQPTGELLANLVLARLRRHTGRPHLALHIVTALARVAPQAFAACTGWEMVLAGDEARAAEMGDRGVGRARAAEPAARALDAVRALVEASRRGDRARFREAAEQVQAATAGRADVAREARALVAALDVAADAEPDVEEWRSGGRALVPCGLQGVGIGAGAGAHLDGDELSTGYVYARPGESGRRLLLPGLGLLPEARLLGGVRAGRLFLRTDSGLSALALAGPAGLPRTELFRRIYGFAYSPNVHGNVFDLLVHRMRARADGAGQIARAGDAIALALETPVLVRDPRCALPFGDRILRELVRLGRATAEEAARALRMPLRTVQDALRQLVAEGSCASRRSGRSITYRVLDTTFSVESRPSADPHGS